MESDNRAISTAELKELLNKYFEGETTLDEERLLEEYFTSGAPAPRELEYSRAIFSHLAEARLETGPQDARSAYHSCSDPETAPALATGGIPTVKKRPATLRLITVSAAAALALVISLTVPRPDNPPVPSEPVLCYLDGEAITDPEVAMEYSREALNRLSNGLQTIAGGMEVLKEFERLEELFDSEQINPTIN